jgi:hypothetical protein
MNPSTHNNSQFLETAAHIDEQLTRRFGVFNQGMSPLVIPEEVNQRVSIAEIAGQSGGLVPLTVRQHFEALTSGASRGQVLGLGYRTGSGELLVHPAILEGASSDGQGVRITYLDEDLSATYARQPEITPLQDALLRAAIMLHGEAVGGHRADSQASTALEPGHKYMGFRAVTDERLVQAIASGQHPVHNWKQTGIAETLTQPQPHTFGMFDVAGRQPVTIRQTILYKNAVCELYYHPTYSRGEQYQPELPAEKVALGIGMVAARSQGVVMLEDKFVSVLGRLGG